MKRAEFGRHSSGTYVRGHGYVEKELYGCQGPMWDQVVFENDIKISWSWLSILIFSLKLSRV